MIYIGLFGLVWLGLWKMCFYFLSLEEDIKYVLLTWDIIYKIFRMYFCPKKKENSFLEVFFFKKSLSLTSLTRICLFIFLF